MSLLDEYMLDLSLPDIDRIEQYIFSGIPIQRFDTLVWFIRRVVHVKLIHSLVERNEIDLIRERILPLFEQISQDSEEMVLLEFVPVVTSIVKLFHEANPDDGAGLSAELVFPLLLSIAMSHNNNVHYLSHHSRDPYDE